MKILIFSDSHGEKQKMSSAVNTERPNMILHLGDFISDFMALTQEFPGIESYGVKGNCDLRTLPGYERDRIVVKTAGRKILVVHGHQYNVKLGYERFYFAAIEAEADIALFGHTHIPYIDTVKGITVMNPGSIGRGITPSYGVININDSDIKGFIVKA